MPEPMTEIVSDADMTNAGHIAEWDARERIRFQARFVEYALSSLIIVNGIWEIGSVTLSFSHLTGPSVRVGMWQASLVFATGIVLAIATYAAAFLSQGFYYRKSLLEIDQALGTCFAFAGKTADAQRFVRGGRMAELVALCTAIMSLIAIALGSVIALSCLRPA